MKITKQQIKIIQGLLNNYKLTPEERSRLHTFITDGRTEISQELTRDEASDMIAYLQKNGPIGMKRITVFSIARHISIGVLLYADYETTIRRINRFLLKRGAVKKPLYDLNFDELEKVAKQFNERFDLLLIKRMEVFPLAKKKAWN